MKKFVTELGLAIFSIGLGAIFIGVFVYILNVISV